MGGLHSSYVENHHMTLTLELISLPFLWFTRRGPYVGTMEKQSDSKHWHKFFGKGFWQLAVISRREVQ